MSKEVDKEQRKVTLSLLERTIYVRPLRRAGYIIDKNKLTIDGKNVSEEDKLNVKLNEKVRWLCTFKGFEEW